MTTHDLRTQALAAMLAALAGYVDAFGFLTTGGYFVSFMSGNSTRMGIGVASGDRDALTAAGLILCFLVGVIGGSLLGHAARDRRRSAVLLAVASLLAASAACSASATTPLVAAPLALSMGMINNVVERNGEVSIGVTYMTGSLVKLGQRIAAVILGTDRRSWASYLALWLSFVAGVLCGAASFSRVGWSGLYGPAVVAAILGFGAWDRAGPNRGNGSIAE